MPDTWPSIRRFTALAMCVIFISVSQLSAAYILSHINHRHNNCGFNFSCTVCVQLIVVENLIKTLSAAIVSVILIYSCYFTVSSNLKQFDCIPNFYNPVRLKVRINN